MINLMALARFKQQLKWIALGLGILSTIAIIRDWYPSILPDLGLLRVAAQ